MIKSYYLTYLINKYKNIKVWHYKFKYTSNTQIIKILNFFINIENFNNIYNL